METSFLQPSSSNLVSHMLTPPRSETKYQTLLQALTICSSLCLLLLETRNHGQYHCHYTPKKSAMAPRGGPSLPRLLAGPGGLPFPWWLECCMLHHSPALHSHRPVPGCLGRALWATGLWVLCQREDTSAATGGGARRLRQAHDQHLQGAGIPHWGGIVAAGMKMRQSGNSGSLLKWAIPQRWPWCPKQRTSKAAR